MIEAFLKFFVVFFVVVSPISILPEFASLTEGATSAYKKRMAIKATVISALIVVLFAVAIFKNFAMPSWSLNLAEVPWKNPSL